MSKVLTVTGAEALKKDCRAIKNTEGVTEFYLIGDIKKKNSGDVFYFPFLEPKASGRKGNYIRLSSGKIFFDHSKLEYTRVSQVENVERGIVGFLEDGTEITGKFSCNHPKKFLPLYYNAKGNSRRLMSYVLVKEHNLKMTTYNGRIEYYNPTFFSKVKLKALETPYRGKLNFSTSVLQSAISNYGAEGNSYFQQFVQEYNNNVIPSLEINKSLQLFSRFLQDQTFGLEIETCAGIIPDDFLLKNALLPCKDGSIGAHEYITVPLKGSSGLSYLDKIFDAAQECTRADEMCSLHIHFGNTGKKTREFVASLYTLYYRLQNELRDFLPPYKKASQYIASKDGYKDHCKFLPNLTPYSSGGYTKEAIKTISDSVYTFFNEGKMSSQSNFDSPNYSGNGKNKWDQLSRYYVLNLVTYFFKPQQTIEFRFHSGTVNKTKALAWLFICSATLSYARAYPDKILKMDSKITLIDVINGFRNNFGKEEEESKEGIFLADYLNAYVLSRKQAFIPQMVKNYNTNNISPIYDAEFNNDHKYKFNYKGKNLTNYAL